MAQGAYVSAPDGGAKTWMWDSEQYRIEPGERKLFPLEVAEQARVFFTPWDELGHGNCAVVVEPVEGELELIERGSLTFPCSVCGRTDIPQAEFAEHVTECVQNADKPKKGGNS